MSERTAPVPGSVARRGEELRAILRDADERYHQKDDPLLSDFEYDQLKDELITLEDRWPALRAPGKSRFLTPFEMTFRRD